MNVIAGESEAISLNLNRLLGHYSIEKYKNTYSREVIKE
jgi:hypothetical protein